MERVPMMRLRVVAAMAVLILGAPAFAAPPAKAPAKTKSRKKETRENSYIVNGTPMPDPPDLRGTYEKQRDDELMTHYRRLARLDYIAQIATDTKDNRLLERVETVRRREVQRHRGAMTRFWEQSRGRAMVGF